jgi:hypothetical protein
VYKIKFLVFFISLQALLHVGKAQVILDSIAKPKKVIGFAPLADSIPKDNWFVCLALIILHPRYALGSRSSRGLLF